MLLTEKETQAKMADIAITACRRLLAHPRVTPDPQQIVGLGHALYAWSRLPDMTEKLDVEIDLILEHATIMLAIDRERALISLVRSRYEGEHDTSHHHIEFLWILDREKNERLENHYDRASEIEQRIYEFLAMKEMKLKVEDRSTIRF